MGVGIPLLLLLLPQDLKECGPEPEGEQSPRRRSSSLSSSGNFFHLHKKFSRSLKQL